MCSPHKDDECAHHECRSLHASAKEVLGDRNSRREVALPHFEPVPASARDAFGNRFHDKLGVGGREMVERLPRTQDVARAVEVAVDCKERKRFVRHVVAPNRNYASLAQLDGPSHAFASRD